jgi:dsRNA-specific ribonuclease
VQLSNDTPDAVVRTWLCGLLGREVERPELYRSALTHRSSQASNNERLEFLGDAVLGMVPRNCTAVFPPLTKVI